MRDHAADHRAATGAVGNQASSVSAPTTTGTPAAARATRRWPVSHLAACTAVGFYNDGRGTALTLAERWDGTRWSIQATPNPATFTQLNGVSYSAPSACTAVGGYANRGAVGLTLAEATS